MDGVAAPRSGGRRSGGAAAAGVSNAPGVPLGPTTTVPAGVKGDGDARLRFGEGAATGPSSPMGTKRAAASAATRCGERLAEGGREAGGAAPTRAARAARSTAKT